MDDETIPEEAIPNIRVLIWDLDESFWSGTLDDAGPPPRPIAQHCALVKSLAARGSCYPYLRETGGGSSGPRRAPGGLGPCMCLKNIFFHSTVRVGAARGARTPRRPVYRA